MARIGIDAAFVSPAGKGLARVQLHSIEALARVAPEHHYTVFVRYAGARELLAPAGVETVFVRGRPAILWEQLGIAREARRRRLDAVLTWTERSSLLGQGPTVIWLFEAPHHRIELLRRRGAGAYQRGSDALTLALWRRSLRRASHVAFGSAATRDEVVAAIPELADRCSVVYPALAPGFGPGRPARDRGRYVFHVGSDDPRDNTEAAVEACRRAGMRLLVAGGWRGAGAEALGRVSDDELVDLYRGAVAYLDPTLFEGFGYGVLEAMACGTPVVASNATSVPEIVGDAALLCDPRAPDELASALRRVADDEALAAELRRRGRARAAEFTWERTAEALTRALGAATARSSAPSRRTSPS